MYILNFYLCTFKTFVESIQITVIYFINAPSMLRFKRLLQFLLSLVFLSICLKLLEYLFYNLYIPEWTNELKT